MQYFVSSFCNGNRKDCDNVLIRHEVFGDFTAFEFKKSKLHHLVTVNEKYWSQKSNTTKRQYKN